MPQRKRHSSSHEKTTVFHQPNRERERERERESKTGPGKFYYLQADIKSFFSSIDQEVLFKFIQKRTKNEEILWLARTIIFHDCARDIAPKIQSPLPLFEQLPKDKSLFKVAKGRGLPIGNLTSQFFANVYLGELDNFVKHVLKVKYYVRYVDDLIIFGGNINQLENYKQKINIFLREKLKLTLHPVKQKISPVNNGIDFVGYIIRADYVLIRRRVVSQWREKIANCSPAKLAGVNSSYLAHAQWANSWSLREKMR